MKVEHEFYGIKKIIPDELELKGYLNQCCQYIDNRAFLEDSAIIVDYIESKGFVNIFIIIKMRFILKIKKIIFALPILFQLQTKRLDFGFIPIRAAL
jgi:hypothetical protein